METTVDPRDIYTAVFTHVDVQMAAPYRRWNHPPVLCWHLYVDMGKHSSIDVDLQMATPYRRGGGAPLACLVLPFIC